MAYGMFRTKWLKAGGPDSGSSGDCKVNRRVRRGHHDNREYADSGSTQQRDPDR